MQNFSPLRYPGGKRKLTPFIKDVFRINNLNDGTYIEPYAGGAAVALSLLLEGYAWNIIINDIDKHIHAFWWSVLHDTETLTKCIFDTKVNMDEWHKQKQVFLNYTQYSQSDVAFATFFLNRTNRSGILHGGVIGGKNQDGPYKIDARFNKKNLISRIELIAKHRSRIELHNDDAIELIKKIAKSLPQKSLIYFDPPYYKKGGLLYINFYTHEDHINVSKTIKTLSCPWIVTYDNMEEVKNLYEGESMSEFSICYSAHLKRPRCSEVMFYRNIIIPGEPKTRQTPFKSALLA